MLSAPRTAHARRVQLGRGRPSRGAHNRRELHQRILGQAPSLAKQLSAQFPGLNELLASSYAEELVGEETQTTPFLSKLLSNHELTQKVARTTGRTPRRAAPSLSAGRRASSLVVSLTKVVLPVMVNDLAQVVFTESEEPHV